MPTIVLYTDLRHESAARRTRDQLLAAWPKGSADPRFVIRHSGDAFVSAATFDACFVVQPTDLSDASVGDLCHALSAAQVPMLVYSGARDPRFQTPATTFLDEDTDIPVAAGMLAGLASRTPGVRQMEESLRYAQSVHESVARLVEQFQDDQLLAASIQRQFLSQEMPQVRGLSCAALFRPIDFLSGDIYHVSRLDEEHIGFFLADAMGHGLPAALMSLYIAGRLTQKEVNGRSYRLLSPSDSMTRLNRDLAATGCSNVRFATAVCGTLNVRTRELKLAAAGHPPPIIMGAGAPYKVEAGGALLGVMEDTEYHDATCTLPAGALLVAYTDGLEDSLNPRRPGEEHADAPRNRHIEFLEQVAREVGGPDPAKMFSRFAQMMDSETGSMHQVDDVTLVGIRVG